MKKNNSVFVSIVIGIVLAGLGGFFAGKVTTAPLTPRDDEVLITENKESGFNVDPPSVLSVVMKDDDQAEARCLGMGGWLDGRICRNVDY